jgi:hypothetical protein
MSKVSDMLGIGFENVKKMAKATVDDNLAPLILRAEEIEAAERLPTELDGRPMIEEPHPPMILCLDMAVGRDFRGLNKPPDDCDTVPKVMEWVAKQQAEHGPSSPAVPRCTFRLFMGERALEEAREYAETHSTIVVMPLVIEFNPDLGF